IVQLALHALGVLPELELLQCVRRAVDDLWSEQRRAVLVQGGFLHLALGGDHERDREVALEAWDFLLHGLVAAAHTASIALDDLLHRLQVPRFARGPRDFGRLGTVALVQRAPRAALAVSRIGATSARAAFVASGGS